MKKSAALRLHAIVMITILTLSSSNILLSQAKGPKTDKLVRESELIVVGKVGKVASEWTGNRERIQTRVTVAVDQTIKGTAAQNSITVVIPGGEVDGIGEWYSHSPKFTEDEDVVLFAKKESGGVLRVSGGEEGKFTVKKDEKTGMKIIPNVGTLDAFTAKLKKAAKDQEAGTKRE